MVCPAKLSDAWASLSASERESIGGEKGLAKATVAIEDLEYDPDEDFGSFAFDVRRFGNEKVLSNLSTKVKMREKAAVAALMDALVAHNWSSSTVAAQASSPSVAAAQKVAAVKAEDDSDEETAAALPSGATAAAAPKVAAASNEDSDEMTVPSGTTPAVAQKAVAAVSKDSDEDTTETTSPSDPTVASVAKIAVAASDGPNDRGTSPRAHARTETLKSSDAQKDDGAADEHKNKVAKTEEEEEKEVDKMDVTTVASHGLTFGQDRNAENINKKESAAEPRPTAAKNTELSTVYVGGLPFHLTQKQFIADFVKCGEIVRVDMPVGIKGTFKGYAFVDFKTLDGVTEALKLDGNAQKYEGRVLAVTVKKQQQEAGKGKGTLGRNDSKGNGKSASIHPNSNGKSEGVTKLQGDLDGSLVSRLFKAHAADDHETLTAIAGEISAMAERAKERKANRDFAVIIRNVPRVGVTETTLKEDFSKYGELNKVTLPKKDDNTNKGCAMLYFKTKEGQSGALKCSKSVYHGQTIKVFLLDAKQPGKKAGGKGKPDVERHPDTNKSNDRPVSMETPEKGNKRKVMSDNLANDPAGPAKKKGHTVPGEEAVNPMKNKMSLGFSHWFEMKREKIEKDLGQADDRQLRNEAKRRWADLPEEKRSRFEVKAVASAITTA